MLCSLLRLSCRKMGAKSETELILCRNGLILRRNGIPVIINDDFFGEGVGESVLLPITHSRNSC